MYRVICNLIVPISLFPLSLLATIFGDVRGIVHDPDHRPVVNVNITLRALSSDYERTAATDANGGFELSAVPVGQYRVSVAHQGSLQ